MPRISTDMKYGIAIMLRVGWTPGSVEDRYLKYQPAGDMRVGRNVCGLPIEKKEFGIFPPHFIKDYDITNFDKLSIPKIVILAKIVLRHPMSA